MEVVVAAVLLAILSAVSMPYIVEFLDKQRAQTTADKLSALASGVAAFNSAVHTGAAATATTYPGKISELANVIITNSTVTHNSCGSAATGTFNAAALTSWNTSGPFVTFMISTTGLVTPLGTVSDSMIRTPSSATVGTLALRMLGVDAGDAVDLDLIVDGGDGGSAGTVQWTTGTAAGTVDIKYFIPVGARC